MKALAWLFAAVAFGVGGCAVTGPYSTVQHIKHAVKTRDEAELAEYVDFPVLRENLKAQAGEAVGKKAGLDGPLAELASGFVTVLAGGVIDYFITPQGLAKLMSGEVTSLIKPPYGRPDAGAADHDSEPGKKQSEKLFTDARYSFDATDQVSVYARNKDSKETRFILTRSGLKWRLTNIVFDLS